MTKTVTKQQLQSTLNTVGERISEALNPALTREAIIEQLQELDELLNGSDDPADDDEDGE